MKKKLLITILTAVFVLAFSATALAADWDPPIEGRNDLHVTYKADGTWDSNLGADWDDPLQGIQPGDTVHLHISLSNEYDGETYWYMENKVLQTLEETQEASGGAYTYTLTYTGPDGKTVDLRDLVVGGENREKGLKDATIGISDEPVFLDKLTKGQGGYITLEVKLDGETQRNAYQLTQAQLQMVFFVEVNDATSSPSTGDAMNMLPFMIALVAAGTVILAVAIVMVIRRKRSRKETE